MRTVALIIGIDDYVNPDDRLTSAVNDAQAFRRTLIELGLVQERDVTLLTAPADPANGARLASGEAIIDELERLYRSGESIDRMFFFYAGHGVSGFTTAARSVVHSALVPPDVADIERQSRKLIDFDEYLDLMSITGPLEQFYFLDACRDLPYDKYPALNSLQFSGEPPGPVRATRALFAVSPLGKALGVRGANGLVTTHAIAALRGALPAIEHDPVTDDYVITMQSIHAYARDEITLTHPHLDKRSLRYILPELRPTGPEPQPIRTLPHVTPVSVTVHIEPDEAAPQTNVAFSVGRQPLQGCSYPPRNNHEAVEIMPQRYGLSAASTWGQAEHERTIDARRVKETHIRVTPLVPAGGGDDPGARGPTPPAPAPRSTPLLAVSDEPAPAMRSLTGTAPRGRITASALEAEVSIELEQTSPPYQKWEGAGTLSETLPVGWYRVRFRLGNDVFSEDEVFLEKDQHIQAKPVAASSALITELLELRPDTQTAQVSESIGDMQAGILHTVLPIIGVKPFDPTGHLFHRFHGLIPQRLPEEFGYRPLSIVIATDGHDWVMPPDEMLRSITIALNVLGPDGNWSAAGEPFRLTPMDRLDPQHLHLSGFTARGFARIATALQPAPGAAFSLLLESPDFGRINLISAALDRRVTVITMVFSSDGSISIGQNLLRFPGVDYRDELVPRVSYGRMLRQLQIGQRLYQAGQLMTHFNAPPKADRQESWEAREIATNLLHAKWTDPVLSCMAFHARHEHARHDPNPHGEDRWLLDTTAINLERYFGDLPDTRVVLGMQFPEKRERVFEELLLRNEVPLLAQSTRVLGAWAEAQDRHEAVAELARRIPHDQIWSVTFGDPAPVRSS